jgi:hypothetical protein
MNTAQRSAAERLVGAHSGLESRQIVDPQVARNGLTNPNKAFGYAHGGSVDPSSALRRDRIFRISQPIDFIGFLFAHFPGTGPRILNWRGFQADSARLFTDLSTASVNTSKTL